MMDDEYKFIPRHKAKVPCPSCSHREKMDDCSPGMILCECAFNDKEGMIPATFRCDEVALGEAWIVCPQCNGKTYTLCHRCHGYGCLVEAATQLESEIARSIPKDVWKQFLKSSLRCRITDGPVVGLYRGRAWIGMRFRRFYPSYVEKFPYVIRSSKPPFVFVYWMEGNVTGEESDAMRKVACTPMSKVDALPPLRSVVTGSLLYLPERLKIIYGSEAQMDLPLEGMES